MITAAEFSCDSLITRSCSGIGTVKNILAPVIDIPSDSGVNSTFTVIQKTNGSIIIAIYSASIILNFVFSLISRLLLSG
jgi:hypothetical protein